MITHGGQTKTSVRLKLAVGCNHVTGSWFIRLEVVFPLLSEAHIKVEHFSKFVEPSKISILSEGGSIPCRHTGEIQP